MLDETTIEQRLVNLERTVTELKRLLIPSPTPSNWLEKVTGSISDEQTFLEVLEYGKSLRYADKPADEMTSEDTGLPVDTYDDSDVDNLSNIVFLHVYQQYESANKHPYAA